MITLATVVRDGTPQPATQAELQAAAVVFALVVAVLYLGWLVLDWVLDGADANEALQ
ncbi:hypothetical protein [Nocardioides lianchengensis]|uniref:Uncharacterized protein n=1 Tax=Nocardioides lianchengensis TaxID=1045774 RepID=A0A1G6LNV2_9ACTN|nr:hypothetical protein [Nocardioides lianchengensis]NYG12490.1 hypothetical protein [Nocardioides lianchengensis]SDC44978.1 hypothetical protein SAMN05421872_102315 [Nocardioides lianchengensis]